MEKTLEATIGLEVHAELKTRTKMFCACRNDANEKHPNINVCPVCLGHPGTLPVPNREAIRLVQRVGAALGCELATFSKFDRKNYFYPDLPKGYQISQYDLPLCSGGSLDLGNGRRIRIRRIHLEEDTGKLVHPEGVPYSVVDFNRAGVPLMELVTEPDLRSADDVALFAQELQRILRYVGASEANMEKGEMRVEVNISLREIADQRRPDADRRGGEGQRESASGPRESALMGVKVEIKNLNSIRSARMAVAFEIARQTKLLEKGEKVMQETRGWHDTKQATFPQRSKEEAHDYRYFPEPDIPPLTFTAADIEAIRAEVPELPAGRRARLREEYGLNADDVEIFVDDPALGDYFERAVSELRAWMEAHTSGDRTETLADGTRARAVSEPRAVTVAANYLLSDLRGILAEHATAADEMRISAEDFAELMKLNLTGKINSRVTKDVLREMFSTGRDPSDIIEERGLGQVSDEGEVGAIVARVIEENPKAVEDYRGGKEASLQFLVGKVMAATQGRVNPLVARELLVKALAGKT